MIKEVPCMECNGKGFIAKFGECSVWSERCPNCGGTGIVKVPMTNADRIRRMSDEELAAYIWPKFGCPDGKNNVTCGYVGNCKDCWLDWLQQSAEEDTHA